MHKMIVRADDVGYTLVNNIGAFEAIENGVVTSSDVMLDCPGTVDALDQRWLASSFLGQSGASGIPSPGSGG